MCQWVGHKFVFPYHFAIWFHHTDTWHLSTTATSKWTLWRLKSLTSPLFAQPDIRWPIFRRRHFQMQFVNGNTWILIDISLKFVPRGQINSILVFVQIVACAVQATSHYMNHWWLVYWRIYASLGVRWISLRICYFCSPWYLVNSISYTGLPKYTAEYDAECRIYTIKLVS